MASRYFLHNWPKLCWLAFDEAHCFGVVVCKADDHRGSQRGYIAMLVVENEYRGLGVGEFCSFFSAALYWKLNALLVQKQ